MTATNHGATCWSTHASCALTAAAALPNLGSMQRAAFAEAQATHYQDRGRCVEAGHVDLCAQVVEARRLLTSKEQR